MAEKNRRESESEREEKEEEEGVNWIKLIKLAVVAAKLAGLTVGPLSFPLRVKEQERLRRGCWEAVIVVDLMSF